MSGSSNRKLRSSKEDRSIAAEQKAPSVDDSQQELSSRMDALETKFDSFVENQSVQMAAILAKLQSLTLSNQDPKEPIPQPTTAVEEEDDSSQGSAHSPSNDYDGELDSPSETGSIIGTGPNNLVTQFGPAAIDDKTKLPPAPKLEGGTTTQPDVYAMWLRVLTDCVEAVPRYRTIFALPPEDGFKAFLASNRKYTRDVLENHYLDAQRYLWAYIISCLDRGIGLQISSDMERDSTKYNLTVILGFKVIEPHYYKDCYSLMQKLSERFQRKSNHRAYGLHAKLSKLRYQIGNDPSIFLSEYLHLQRQLATLCPDHVMPSETMQALEILYKLPDTPSMDTIRESFLAPDKPVKFQAVQDHLLNWFIALNKEGNKGKKSPNKSESAHAAVSSGQQKSKNKWKDKYKGRKPDNSDNEESDQEQWSWIAHEDATIASSGSYVPQSHVLVFDSGATTHLTGDRDRLRNTRETAPCKISGLGGDRISKVVGKLKLSSTVALEQVRYVPSTPFTLLSIPQVTASGCQVVILKDSIHIVKPNTVGAAQLEGCTLLKGKRQGNLYVHDMGLGSDPDDTKGDFVRTPYKGTIPKKGADKPVTSQTARDSISEARKVRFQNSSAKAATPASKASASQPSNAKPASQTAAAAIEIAESDTESDDYSDQDDYPDLEATEFIGMADASPLDATGVQSSVNNTDTRLALWHNRLAHLGQKQLGLTNTQYGLGLTKETLDSLSNCTCAVCTTCKATHAPIGSKAVSHSNTANGIMDV